MQNDASTYWTFTCGISSSLPISSMRELFVLIPLSKTNSSMKYLLFHKVENFQLPRLDLILSPSPSMKIQIVSGKITEIWGSNPDKNKTYSNKCNTVYLRLWTPNE